MASDKRQHCLDVDRQGGPSPKMSKLDQTIKNKTQPAAMQTYVWMFGAAACEPRWSKVPCQAGRGGHRGHSAKAAHQAAPQKLPVSGSRIPKIAIVSHTSNIAQNGVGNCLALNIMQGLPRGQHQHGQQLVLEARQVVLPKSEEAFYPGGSNWVTVGPTICAACAFSIGSFLAIVDCGWRPWRAEPRGEINLKGLAK